MQCLPFGIAPASRPGYINRYAAAPAMFRSTEGGTVDGMTAAEFAFVNRHLGDRSKCSAIDAVLQRGRDRMAAKAAQRKADTERRVNDAKRQLAARRGNSQEPGERNGNHNPAAARQRINEARAQFAARDLTERIANAHRDPRWGTAIHEAAHAVACIKNGLRFTTATVTATSTYLGRVDTQTHAGDYAEYCPSLFAGMCLAGSYAQTLVEFGRCDGRYMSRGDQCCINLVVAHWPANDRARFMAATEQTAKVFVENNMPAIRKVARHLVANGTMTRDQIEALLK